MALRWPPGSPHPEPAPPASAPKASDLPRRLRSWPVPGRPQAGPGLPGRLPGRARASTISSRPGAFYRPASWPPCPASAMPPSAGFARAPERRIPAPAAPERRLPAMTSCRLRATRPPPPQASCPASPCAGRPSPRVRATPPAWLLAPLQVAALPAPFRPPVALPAGLPRARDPAPCPAGRLLLRPSAPQRRLSPWAGFPCAAGPGLLLAERPASRAWAACFVPVSSARPVTGRVPLSATSGLRRSGPPPAASGCILQVR